MSRELNRKQRQIILAEIQANKESGLENPYVISTDTYFKCMEINDHETFYQNVEHFIDDIKYSDDDDFFLGQWQSVKYENWLKAKGLHNSNAVIRGEQIEKMS
tara:strand:- start:654 stop:962 length:309 start_codon:yes stop_codon:yes gene_type:complete